MKWKVLIGTWMELCVCVCVCAQVCIPVQVPGQPLMSVAVVGLQRSDLRLLTAAEKLGPMISECAAKLAAAQQLAPAAAPNGKAASPSPSPKGPMVNGHAKKASPGEHLRKHFEAP